MTLSIEVDQLRNIANRLIDTIERDYGRVLSIGSSPRSIAEYWEFDLETAYTCADNPAKQAGDVSADYDELVESLSRTDEEIVLWHDLDHLAGVLRGLAFLDLEAQTRKEVP
jgi:hypothetical protein